MSELFANFASTVLSAAAGPTDTILALEDAAMFPAPAAGEFFRLVLEDHPAELREVCRCMARSGNALMVERGREGTAPLAWTAGTRAENRVTAATLRALAEHEHPGSGGGGSNPMAFVHAATINDYQVMRFTRDDGSVLDVPLLAGGWAGLAWAAKDGGTTKDLTGVCYDEANGLYPALAPGGTIITSPDCEVWTDRSVGGSGANYDFGGASRANGLSFALGVGSNLFTRYSADGAAWTPVTSLVDSEYCMVFHDGLYIAGVSGTGGIRTSPDLAAWTTRTSNMGSTVRGLAKGGLLIAVGLSGGMASSTNGTTWTQRTSNTTQHLFGATWDGALYIAVGNAGTILTSNSGTSWASRTSGVTDALRGVAHRGGLRVAVGHSGTVLTSPDGLAWSRGSSGTVQDLRAVCHGGGRWVAVGAGGTIIAAPEI
jgi:hypothetical protein